MHSFSFQPAKLLKILECTKIFYKKLAKKSLFLHFYEKMCQYLKLFRTFGRFFVPL